MTFIASAFAEKGALKTPTLSDALKALALPAMAEAAAKDEGERAALELVESVKASAERFGGKIEIIGKSK